MKSKLVPILLVMAGLVGCRFPAIAPQTPVADAPGIGQAQPAPALQGRVDFGQRVQANIPDVIAGATVSLINIGAAQTVSTALTDAQGNFVLTFSNGYVADPTATYYLEAVKGVGSHVPGQDALRVRTIIRYVDGWTSLTNATPNAGIVVNPSTTALSVAAGLRNGKPDPIDFSRFIGSLSGSQQNAYSPATGISASDYTTVLGLVNDCLAADKDPVAGIGLDLSAGWLALNQQLTVASLDKTSGSAGTSVTLTGTGFDLSASKNLVAFNGVEAPVTAATPTQLTTSVPLGATSGQLTVQVAKLVAMGPTFTVPVSVTGFSPASGRMGTPVTVTGSGFSAKLWENAVTFAGVPGTVTRATPTELTVTVPPTQTGALAVTVSGQSATGGSFVYESPMLAAVTPSTERAGRVITLEGNFGPTAVVNFPGGVSVPASGGGNRLYVTVPDGATTGELTVTTEGRVTNARPFHRTAGLGVELFTRWLPQTSYARALPKLGTARIYLTAEVIGNRVYAIGGNNGSGPLSSVEVARIDADGSLSSFTAAPSLQTAREGHASVVIGSYLYVLGGKSGTALASIERAPINVDGTLGAFEAAGTLTTAREGLTAFVAGNRLHVMGGKNTAPVASVESALIREDGSLEAFQNAGISLETARSGHTVHVVRDHAYVVAGTGASGLLGSVERAPILTDGRLGAFQTLGVALITPRANHHSLLLGDTLTVFGGGPGGDKAERATIKPDGSMEAFVGLPQVFSSNSCKAAGQVVVGNAAYLLGGSENSGGTPSLGIWRAPIDVNLAGAPPRFESIGYASLPVFRKNAPSAIVGDSLYVFGGLDANMVGIKSVLRARIQPDGTLGAFETIPTAVTFGTDMEAVTVLDGQVYLRVGQRVARTAQGLDLGVPSFSTGYTTTTNRELPTTVQLDDRLYVIGGSGSESNNERATIQPDGSLSSFGTGPRLSLLRRRHVTAVVGNYLYALGGNFPSSELVERALIQPMGSGHTIGNFATIPTGTTTMGQADYVTFNPIQPVTLIGNALYDFSEGSSGTVKRLRIGSKAEIAWPEQVPFRFLGSDTKTACHLTGNVLHFVSERGIESVRIR